MLKLKENDILKGFNPEKDLFEDGIVRAKIENVIVKDQSITVKQYYLLSKDNVLLTNNKLDQVNDLIAFDEYRKVNRLLTSEEIKAIRQKRGWTQEEMAQMLDIGLKDIARFENGAIQSRVMDHLIRLVGDDDIFIRYVRLLKKNYDFKTQST